MFTLSRILNNTMYGTYIVIVPFFIALLSEKQGYAPAQIFMGVQTCVNAGFLLASLIGTCILKNNPQYVGCLIYLTYILAMLAVLGSFQYTSLEILIASAFLLGAGSYCFRVSGMSLGQAITPPHLMGHIIIAGDTLVRGTTFLIGVLTTFVFSYQVSSCIPLIIIFIVSSYALSLIRQILPTAYYGRKLL
jgi:hypothetical protein